MNKWSCPTFARGYARLHDGTLVHESVIKTAINNPAFKELWCPDCSNRARYNRCLKRANYLAHQGKKKTFANGGVSRLHEEALVELKKNLEKEFPSIIFYKERRFSANKKKGLRKIEPDLCAKIPVFINGKKEFILLAIEVQRSEMSSTRFLERTMTYKKWGFVVLWIKPIEGEFREKHRPRMTEKLIHALSLGYTFYWKRGYGANVLPVKYFSVPGYKATKKLVAKDLVSLKDFFVKKRSSFTPPFWNKSLPQCRIFVPKRLFKTSWKNTDKGQRPKATTIRRTASK